VDLRVQLVAPLPSNGPIHLVCRPIKAGGRLWIGEVLVDDGRALLARGLATFLNHRGDRNAYNFVRPPEGDVAVGPYDDWLAPRFVDDHTLEIDKTPHLSNRGTGTIQGGAQATLAEIASEWVLAEHGPYVVEDLDIRYLTAARTGPVTARADVAARRADQAFLRVRLSDEGEEGLAVAHSTTVCRRMA
jgi:acyl-coenzyme A thioesterase PaaI-like protein